MNQRDQTEDQAAERLQTLYEASFPPAYPSVEPSEALRRRVAEMAARREAEAAGHSGARPSPRWAVVGAALLFVVGMGWWSGGRRLNRSTGSELRLADRGGVPARGTHRERGRAESSSEAASQSTLASASRYPLKVGGTAPTRRSAPTYSSLHAWRGPAPLHGQASAHRGPQAEVGAWDGELRGAVQRALEGVEGQRQRVTPAEWEAAEAQVRLSVRVRDDFVTIPFPRLAAAGDRPMVAAVEQYRREAAVVDTRLAREVALQAKAMALSDLCDRLRGDSGIRLVAGNSVADEKVIIFCEKMPLREVMRQLSRPFGYTWLRSGKPGEYRYELVQDLKSQLLEEELRNRDRNEALLALEKEIEKYRPYLSLTSDEALARSETAPPQERALLKTLSGPMWAALQMYSRLSPRDLAAMRAGQSVVFSGTPRPGEQPVPTEVERGVIQTFRDWKVAKQGDEYRIAFDAPGAEPISLAEAPGVRAGVMLTMEQTELGRVALSSYVFWGLKDSNGKHTAGGGTGDHSVVGVSPTVARPDNAVLNARFEREPALRARVSIELEGKHPADGVHVAATSADASATEKKVTTADALEALHRATGMPIVADYYTRLYKPGALSTRNMPLFQVLNRLGDGMRMRWNRQAGGGADRRGAGPRGEAGGWLQFRSTSYYDDRVKEVPNRLLAQWAASRKAHGGLTLDDLIEIAGLPDAQLDATEMAEGAREIWGLAEWTVPVSERLRGDLRFLAGFTPGLREEAQSAAGLPFLKMPLAQQQRFLARGLDAGDEPLGSLDELAGATLRVDYSQPGWFQWGDARHPGAGVYTRWVVPLEPGRQGRRVPRPPVRERTREAALEAVRRVDPQLRQALLEGMRRLDPRLPPEMHVVEEDQIFPSQLDLTLVYIRGATSARGIMIQNLFASYETGPP